MRDEPAASTAVAACSVTGLTAPAGPQSFLSHLVELAAPVPNVIPGIFSDQRHHVRHQAAPD